MHQTGKRLQQGLSVTDPQFEDMGVTNTEAYLHEIMEGKPHEKLGVFCPSPPQDYNLEILIKNIYTSLWP